MRRAAETTSWRRIILASWTAVALGALATGCQPAPAPPPAAAAAILPSWNDGPTRDAILEFVSDVTTIGSPHFVPEAERIAVFDNDGTLWSEQPIYVQLAFAMDRVRAMASDHPEWAERQPFKGVLEGDMEAVAATGEHGLFELVMATHAGMTSVEFGEVAKEWIRTARHPRLDRPYTECVYQPMLELLQFLRESGFQTWIVSGGGIDFMRPWTEEVYGIPPEQVVGTTMALEFQMGDDGPVLLRLPELDHVDDKAGKPVSIQRFIGRRPIAAFGNSDGDLQMLQWTTSAPGRRLGVIVHHTDGERETAYDRDSHIGRLVEALEQAPERGWVVVDMKNDWATIFPPSGS